MAVSQEPVRRFEFIDALRGWAFLGVLVTHLTNDVAPGWFLGQVTWRGPFGVQLFFVVSALTLLLSMRSRWGKDEHPLAAFFIRRFFRIAPMFWLALLFYVPLLGFKGTHWAPDGITPNMIAATGGFVHGWKPEFINSVVPGGWSIAVEMNFYLLLPLLFLAIRSTRQAVAFWFVSLIFGVMLRHWMLPVIAAHYPAGQLYLVTAFLYMWLPAQISVFSVGIVVYFLLRKRLEGGVRGEASPTLNHPGVLLAASLFVGAVVTTFLKSDWLPTQDLFAVAFGLLAWGLAYWPVRVLVNPVMRYAGKVSYSAYLTHFVLLRPSEFLVERLHGPFPRESALQFMLVLAIAFVLTLAVSTVTHRLVEIPGQELGKRFVRFADEALRAPRGALAPAFVKPESEPLA